MAMPGRIQKFTETLPGGVKHTIFKAGWDGPLDDTRVFVVPAGHLFGMGDNRDNSTDSRVGPEDGGVGFVPAENLMARADVMLGSYDYLGVRSLGSLARPDSRCRGSSGHLILRKQAAAA